MVVKDREKEDLKLFVKEQLHDNKLYRITKSYAPNIGIDEESIRISISYPKTDYVEEHGVEIIGETTKSYYLRHKENKSTFDSGFLDDVYGYVEEIKNGFSNLINSNDCELTDKALAILDKINTKVK